MCTGAGLPIRPLYEDWLRAPLLHDRTVLTGRWPHLRHTAYTPPDPAAFPNYAAARRQTLLIKIPDVPADAYMAQAGAALCHILTRL